MNKRYVLLIANICLIGSATAFEYNNAQSTTNDESQTQESAILVASVEFLDGNKHRQPSENPEQVDPLLGVGQQQANSTQLILGKNLVEAIHAEGTIGAIGFCNENAIPLTKKSLSDNIIAIKRVSDLNRNPMNVANDEELKYISQTKRLLDQGGVISAKIVVKDNSAFGYYPILSRPMCLQCHGVPGKDIEPEVYRKIKQLYPEDKAVGYGVNDLRGIWVLEMSN